MLARVEMKGLPLGLVSVGMAVGPNEASGLGEKVGGLGVMRNPECVSRCEEIVQMEVRGVVMEKEELQK